IHWTGRVWELRDLSRNGSLVDGRRVPVGCSVPLQLGSLLSFTHDSRCSWRVEDLAGPSPMLLPLDGGPPLVLAPAQVLPLGPRGALRVVQEEQGRWLCTGPQGIQPLEDGDELLFDDRRWCFVSGADRHSTQGQTAAAGERPTSLELRVSLDEEHVWLTLHHEGHVLDLGERSHHYALLTLARLRRQDADRGMGREAQGWVEHGRLAAMLGLDGSHLNIQLFRLRKQITQAMPASTLPPALIERRRGELRLHGLPFRVHRGDELQSSYEPRAQGPQDVQGRRLAEALSS
ncbi:MAG TPA: FHA domain-containing protein, partial [Burkholderiaceae bacterium]|nr:FHA domain-containing protein [Burkholderiaceae bacterium]